MPRTRTSTVSSTYHYTIIDGCVYRDYRKLEIVVGDDHAEKSSLLTHYKSIDDKFYVVREEKRKDISGTKRSIYTNVESGNLETFKNQWDENWKPILP